MFKDFSDFNNSVKTMRLTGYDAQISALIAGLKSIQSAGSSMVDAYARNYVMVQTLGSDTNGNVIDQTDEARQKAADAALVSIKRAVQSTVDGATSLKRYLNSIPLPKTATTETLYSVEAGEEFLPGWINGVAVTPDFKCQANLNGGDALTIRKSWWLEGAASTNKMAIGSGVMYRHSTLPWAIYQMHANFDGDFNRFSSLFVLVARINGSWKVQVGSVASHKTQLADSYYTFDSEGLVNGCSGGTEIIERLDLAPQSIDDIMSVIPMQATLPTQAVYALATFVSLMPDFIHGWAGQDNVSREVAAYNALLKSGKTVKPILVPSEACGFMALSMDVSAEAFPTITTDGESILSGEIIPVANNISSLGDALVAATVTNDIDRMNDILQNA